MTERIRLAARSPMTVVSASGLLADFNDAGILAPLDVTAAQTVGRLHGEDDEQVLLAAALAVRSTRHGHVCVRLSALREAVVVDGADPDDIEALPWPDSAAWAVGVSGSRLVGDGSGDHPLVLSEDRLYLERYFRFEQQVADLIGARVRARSTPTSPLVEEHLASSLGDSTSQQRAVRIALEGKLAVIAGGPGTGKTYAIGAMLVALAKADPDQFPLVAVCAPTGKAAARLEEAITDRAADDGNPVVAEVLAGVSPSTIHRLLGWTWGRSRFARNAHNRLPHDVVIVDEMSMVSLPLAARLLAAVRDDATVVLVGDPFQLESIEAGTVLADIVGPAADQKPPAVPIRERVTVLDRVYRFEEDSVIASFAEAVRRGDHTTAVDLLTDSGQLRWVRNADGAEFEELWSTVVDQRARLVELARNHDAVGALEALTEVAVLCAHRHGPAGVSGWSRRIESALDERYPGLRWKGEWYPGRPVMITRNDYLLDLYNGDIGVAVGPHERMQAVFERGGLRAFPLSHLTEHTTVHAMTIHKSQGSQFDQVVVVLPDEGSHLLTRELLYTAATRARERVWLVGSEAVIRQAIHRSVQRASGLGELLWR